jgi:hypothetical protein
VVKGGPDFHTAELLNTKTRRWLGAAGGALSMLLTR